MSSHSFFLSSFVVFWRESYQDRLLSRHGLPWTPFIQVSYGSVALCILKGWHLEKNKTIDSNPWTSLPPRVSRLREFCTSSTTKLLRMPNFLTQKGPEKSCLVWLSHFPEKKTPEKWEVGDGAEQALGSRDTALPSDFRPLETLSSKSGYNKESRRCYHSQGLPVTVENLKMILLWTLLFHLRSGRAELFSQLGLIYTAYLKSLPFI